MTVPQDAAGFGVPTGRIVRFLSSTLLRVLHSGGQVVCRVPIRRVGFEHFEGVGQAIVVSSIVQVRSTISRSWIGVVASGAVAQPSATQARAKKMPCFIFSPLLSEP